MASMIDLIRALPEPADEPTERTVFMPESWSLRPVPVGRFRRLRALGTLQAKIGAAYLFHWLRGWFRDADDNQRHLAETHWRTAVRVLDSMGYLRGAVMKVGQTLANFPDIVPAEFVETLERLHWSAPPMHWSLIEELVLRELGDDPGRVFASFEKRAVAAASLGQVHRATLKSGRAVAVKVQYPGIARAIRDDVRNLLLLLTPGRLDRDWQNTREQLDDLRLRLERETDYEREADTTTRMRALFREDDGIVIPRVHPEHSTSRVLTTEWLEGLHLDEFLAADPPQERRDAFARKIVTAWLRMLYAGRTVYGDMHPGNFVFLEDGRLGVIDFGFMVELDDATWALMEKVDLAMASGRIEDRIACVKEWSWIGEDTAEDERVRLYERFADWQWRSRYTAGDFDFGDEAEFRRGVDLFVEMVRKRYSRSRPCTPALARQQFGVRSLLYRLRARINLAEIADREVRATGWDRSDHAARH
ncbi:ABC1 kinase family protein [Aquisphaera insulae]|uniref:ABC1 kinase family protein n=1 Tax=Aquisphaera insulae TaxID=2712864 RepID=UPI0013ECC7C7|nr:AarF/ABC1/UbiB kinase family protein [Aquisphaera insulae]